MLCGDFSSWNEVKDLIKKESIMQLEYYNQNHAGEVLSYASHHAEMDLNKNSGPKKKTIQAFKVDANRFRKTMN